MQYSLNICFAASQSEIRIRYFLIIYPNFYDFSLYFTLNFNKIKIYNKACRALPYYRQTLRQIICRGATTWQNIINQYKKINYNRIWIFKMLYVVHKFV